MSLAQNARLSLQLVVKNLTTSEVSSCFRFFHCLISLLFILFVVQFFCLILDMLIELLILECSKLLVCHVIYVWYLHILRALRRVVFVLPSVMPANENGQDKTAGKEADDNKDQSQIALFLCLLLNRVLRSLL